MRKHFKKMIVLMLALGMLLFAACGVAENESTDTGATETATSEAASETETPAATETDSASEPDVSDYIADSLPVLESVFGAGGAEAGEGLEFNLGMLLAMTGDGEFYGKQMSRGAELAAELVWCGYRGDYSVGAAVQSVNI
jgi:hypothetical protein